LSIYRHLLLENEQKSQNFCRFVHIYAVLIDTHDSSWYRKRFLKILKNTLQYKPTAHFVVIVFAVFFLTASKMFCMYKNEFINTTKEKIRLLVAKKAKNNTFRKNFNTNFFVIKIYSYKKNSCSRST
jgi:hypothetical protein